MKKLPTANSSAFRSGHTPNNGGCYTQWYVTVLQLVSRQLVGFAEYDGSVVLEREHIP